MGLLDSVYEEPFGELLLVAPLFLVALLGVAVVQAAARRLVKVVVEYGAVPSRCGLSGEMVARRLLAVCRIDGVKLAATHKQDHYHPWWREIRLNRLTYESPSLAALAVAAHEVGHAEQFAERTTLCRLRAVAWPLCYVLLAAAIVPPVVSLVGLGTLPITDISAIVLPAALGVLVLQLPIHLPLEADATRRARRMVADARLIGEHEYAGFDRVLAAAWWTHFAGEAQRWVVVLLAAGVTFWATHAVGLTELDFDDALALEALEVLAEPPQSFAPPIAPQAMPAQSPASPHVSPVPPPPYDPMLPITDPFLGFDLVFLAIGPVLLLGTIWLMRMLFPDAGGKLPSVPPAMERNNAGFVLLHAGDAEGAARAFSETLQLEPEYLPALLNRARTYTSLGRLDEAVRDYDAAVLLAPESAMPRERRADLHAARGDYSRAIEDYSAVIAFDGDRATAFRDRGLMRFFGGEYTEALADCNRAIEIDARLFGRGDAAVYNNRGAVYIKLGEYARARADLDAAIRLDPQFPHAYKNLAWLEATCPAAEFRDGASAVAHATKALAIVREQIPEWFAVMAAAHAEARQFDEAVAWQSKYVAVARPESRASAEAVLGQFKNGQSVRDMPAKLGDITTSTPAILETSHKL